MSKKVSLSNIRLCKRFNRQTVLGDLVNIDLSIEKAGIRLTSCQREIGKYEVDNLLQSLENLAKMLVVRR